MRCRIEPLSVASRNNRSANIIKPIHRPTDRIPGIDGHDRIPEIRSFHEIKNTHTHGVSTSNQTFKDVNISLHIDPGIGKTSTYNRSSVNEYHYSHTSKVRRRSIGGFLFLCSLSLSLSLFLSLFFFFFFF